MQRSSFRTLEFDKVLSEVADCATLESTKTQIQSLVPYENEYELKEQLAYLGEAIDIARKKGAVQLFGYAECSEFVHHAQKGGTIREGALLKIASCLRMSMSLKKYIFPEEGSNITHPKLEEIADELEPLAKLEKKITEDILSEDEISDNASTELYEIRRRIRLANSKIKDKLNSYVSGGEKKYLQENIITMRNGRYVVPLKSENKGQIPGIVHDSSASGLTLFVEPSAVVELNNKLRELEISEKREIENILSSFSVSVKNSAMYILNNERIVLLMDFFFAKAEYAIRSTHSLPNFIEERKIELYEAFHPLITREKAVASDILIGSPYNQMVITGPNTGGKTVTLKTLGLCVLMAQSALAIPTGEKSSLCMFERVFADIGDEQSISQSLSTFSSHMTNICDMLEDVSSSSLILIDELGAGTDPSEGAALAKAILLRIKESGAICLATTHYNEIKQYALTTEGVVNASMEFDVAKLCPTYRLKIGIPGKSNAFEISRRLGLNEEILKRANEFLTKENIEFEDILSQLEAKLLVATDSSEKAQRLLYTNEKLQAELEKRNRELNEKVDKALSNAAVEAKKIVVDAKNTAKKIMEEADRYKNLDATTRNQHRQKVREITGDALDVINRNIPTHELKKVSAEKTVVENFKVSDEVYIPDIKCEGVILSIKKDEAMVQVGAIKTKMPLTKLTKNVKTKKSQATHFKNTKARTISPKLDIRGITATEVYIELEKYLDDAYLAGLKCVTIVHGKGNGVLRKAVANVLDGISIVESYRSGGLKEGSEGATIVYLS